MRLAWASDIHLNFIGSVQRRWFLNSIKEKADALIISGDIGESNDICEMLNQIDTEFSKPTYFVLGNHDFYRGSIKQVRLMVSRLAYGTQNLFYLSNNPIIELTPTTALIGHDGFADGRFGNMDASDVMLNDFSLIEELHCWRRDKLDKPALRKVLEKFGDEAAAHIALALPPAVYKYPNVFVATHVPPFREATWHEGHQSDDNFLPYFACKAVGDVILKLANERPECKITVLCGHTHSSGEVNITENLRVLTASGEYKFPRIHQVFDV